MATDKKKVKKDRLYKCQYCDFRATRSDLVYHIDEEHEDMIPENFTAARLVFNYINKKEAGRCTVCGKESPWNEEVWRYDRYCSKKCNQEYVKIAKARMVNVYGKEHLLGDGEHQKKMLASRKISGTYKFKDGGVRDYCGSYERKLLEFYDKVLNVPSSDIMTPGPIIEYMYKGKKHQWITDLLYIPANLVHDVKDGGDNPNKRQMDEYREKQVAKEEAITKLDKYNYIRLTNNNFQQLLLILSEIKELLLDNSEENIIRINEDAATAGVMANATDADVYIIPYYMNNTFLGTAISSDKYMKDLHVIKDGKCVKGKVEDLKECDFMMYQYKGEEKHTVDDIVNSCTDKEDLDSAYFYSHITNKRLLSTDQFEYDELLQQVIDGFSEGIIKEKIIESSLIHKVNDINKENFYVPLVSLSENAKCEEICKEFNNVILMQDLDGYFAYNNTTDCRTPSFNNLEDLYTSENGMNYIRILDNINV